MKKTPKTAGLLALTLWAFWGHHFYLGNWGTAVAYLLLFWTGLPLLFSLVYEFPVFYGMDRDDFDKEYNQK